MQPASNKRSNNQSEWVQQPSRKDRRNNNKQETKKSHNKSKNICKKSNEGSNNRNRYENIVEQKPEPSTRNYAGVIKPDAKSDNANTKNITYVGSVSNYKFIHPYHRRKSIRNQLSKDRNSSIEAWGYAYFKNILDLRRIFEEGIKNLKNIRIDTTSIEFFDNFSRFIKEYSSGEISTYLEDLNEYEEDMYFKYIIAK